MSALHEWFAGLTCDHLYADCPSRTRAEASLRECGWWDVRNAGGWGVDPHGGDVCGLCVHRFDRSAVAVPRPKEATA